MSTRQDSLIEYPCAFPIKVMGLNRPDFVAAIIAVAQSHDPQFNPMDIEQRPSSGSNYLGLTLTITATSREQLDNVYRSLSSHPMVKVVL